MKLLSYLLALLAVLGLLGCSAKPVPTQPTTEPTTVPTAEVPPETTISPETTAAVTTAPTETTLPEHSGLYIPGLDPEDVIRYFNEVCLDAEFVNAGNPKVVQKWMSPIRFRIHGTPTEEDLAVLDGFVQWLSGMEGFPGMYRVEEEGPTDLQIHFCGYDEMLNIMGDQFAGTDGCVTFWYNGINEIYDATICYLSTIDQYIRNSVILEEIYNGLGPVQDTELRPDSLIYAGYSTPQELTEIDELILRLLYHPDMRPGMTPEECETVIRALYY